MPEVSTFRLYLLRAAYLIIAVGLGTIIWPTLAQPPQGVEHMRGVVRALLAAVGLQSLVGIPHPLRMLPLLFFELVWKTIWVVAIGLPLWLADGFMAGTRETWRDCLVGIALCLVVIPWGYVIANYVRVATRPPSPASPALPLDSP
jgi:hypothetical protein